jgi:hypothetical protein
LGLSERRGERPDGLARYMAPLPTGENIEADRPRPRAFGPNAMTGGFLGVLGDPGLELGLGMLVSRKTERVEQMTGGSFALRDTGAISCLRFRTKRCAAG